MTRLVDAIVDVFCLADEAETKNQTQIRQSFEDALVESLSEGKLDFRAVMIEAHKKFLGQQPDDNWLIAATQCLEIYTELSLTPRLLS